MEEFLLKFRNFIENEKKSINPKNKEEAEIAEKFLNDFLECQEHLENK